MANVRVEKLTKIFKSRAETVVAVDDLNVEIPDQEFAVFVGPSGSGKSTFLRLVAGLEAVSSGRVFIGDQDVTTLHPRERGIAMVFQDYALYPHMNVAEEHELRLAEPPLSQGGNQGTGARSSPYAANRAAPGAQAERAKRRSAPESCARARHCPQASSLHVR